MPLLLWLTYGARDDDDAPQSFARYWLHARFLLVNGAKMSKRDGSLITVKSLLDPARWGASRLQPELEHAGFVAGQVAPAVLRLALISTPFSQPMSFVVDGLVQARAGVERLRSLASRVSELADDAAPSGEVAALLAGAQTQLDAALDDQLNMPKALAAVFGVVHAANQRRLSGGDASALRGFLGYADAILGVLSPDAESGSLTLAELAQRASQRVPEPVAVGEWLAARFAARRAGDYTRADAIRTALVARGFELEDTTDGVRWRRR